VIVVDASVWVRSLIDAGSMAGVRVIVPTG
jgi:hypothetical protein